MRPTRTSTSASPSGTLDCSVTAVSDGGALDHTALIGVRSWSTARPSAWSCSFSSHRNAVLSSFWTIKRKRRLPGTPTASGSSRLTTSKSTFSPAIDPTKLLARARPGGTEQILVQCKKYRNQTLRQGREPLIQPGNLIEQR